MSSDQRPTAPALSASGHGGFAPVARARRLIRIETAHLAALLPVRTLVVSLALALVIIAAGLGSMAIGAYDVDAASIIRALTDPASDPDIRQVVWEWRLPRVLFAMLCGAALALAGGIFQSLTRNPLGSPDIIGFGVGAQFGVTLVMVVLEWNTYLFKAAGALVGGLLTALLVFVLSRRRAASSFRLIIIGIGVSAGLGALTSWILISVSIEKAMMAATWGAGSLASLGFDQLIPAALLFAIVTVLSLPLARTLPVLEMGDDAATALGMRPGRTRLAAMVSGVALMALVTAAAGPISFIALAAPQIAQRLTRASSPMGTLSVMLTGSALVVVSDAVAQLLAMPVGVVTVSVGGIYLAWVLTAQYLRRP